MQPEWPEVWTVLRTWQTCTERPALVARVFHQKKTKFLAGLRVEDRR